MVSVVKKLLPGAAGTAGSGGGDDDFASVKTLIHADGSNAAQNNTFIDSSDNSLTVTAGSDTPIQGTFSPFSADEGNWSVYFDGSAAHNPICAGTGLGAAPNDVYAGTSDFTLEFFVFTTIRQQTLFDSRSGINASTGIVLYQNGSGALVWYVGADKITASASAMTAGAWNHIALSRTGGTSRMWINGTHIGSFSDSFDYTNLGNYCIGGPVGYLSSYVFKGHISNFRFIKGTAIYSGSGDITVPTSALTAVTNTKLLTCQSNRYKDNSTVGNAMGTIGSAYSRIQPFSPFKNSAEYNPAVHGGSFLFQQNANSYLEADHATLFDFGTADQCIEAWLYPTQTSFSTSWAMWFNTKGVNQYWAYTDGGGNSSIAGFSTYPTNTYSASNSHILRPYEWNHCVFQTTGGVQNWYLNGTRIYEATTNPNFSSSATGVRIGNSPAYASYFYYGGYISDLRVTTGTNYNPYSNASTLTVPTAPLTKGSYTRLLLNGTNAKIIDQAGKSNIETVGNAQLSTSVKKFGTASAKFDHTGDYLTLPVESFVSLGGGDFTIECFVYHTSTPNGNGQGYFQLSNGYMNSQVRGPAAGAEGNDGKWTMFAGTTQYTHTGLPQINTWYHVAMVRNSGTTKLYVDGTEYLSASDNTDYTDVYFVIGGWYSTAYLMDGYIDDFRITRKARYTSNFTAPTVAHPNI